MEFLFMNKIQDFLEENPGNVWYITKQSQNIWDILDSVNILYSFKNNSIHEDYNDYFESQFKKIQPKYKERKILPTRIISNASYLGFTDTRMKIVDRTIFESFDPVREIVSNESVSNFKGNNKLLQIIERQTEKMMLCQYDEKDKKREIYMVHPLFVLYKALLLVGEYTSEYSITLDEFKYFICTVKHFNEIYWNINGLFENRILNRELNIPADIRVHNLLVNNSKALELSRGRIFIKNDYVAVIKDKVEKYEKKVLPFLNKKLMYNALISKKDIFEYFDKVNEIEKDL